ncbi:MAG TPA: hypothetical protein VFV38_12690 [Ktedonobacteraceae bacterium]|nr:hypothetical protein [Ktedonobacteraceae bacterium]
MALISGVGIGLAGVVDAPLDHTPTAATHFGRAELLSKVLHRI